MTKWEKPFTALVLIINFSTKICSKIIITVFFGAVSAGLGQYLFCTYCTLLEMIFIWAVFDKAVIFTVNLTGFGIRK